MADKEAAPASAVAGEGIEVVESAGEPAAATEAGAGGGVGAGAGAPSSGHDDSKALAAKAEPVFCDAPPLSEENKVALNVLRETLDRADFDLGVITRMPLDDACLCRYLRARDWNVEKAVTMIRATLAWRTELDVAHIHEGLELEATPGKILVRGHDKRGHPIIIMRPRLENTFDHEGNIRFTVYNLERAIRAMPPGVERWVAFLDCEGYGIRNAPPMKTSMATLRIFQDHYPERLHHYYIMQPSWLFSGFWRVIRPFIDPVTSSKISMHSGSASRVGKEMSEFFELSQIQVPFGGSLGVEYDRDAYLGATPDAMTSFVATPSPAPQDRAGDKGEAGADPTPASE